MRKIKTFLCFVVIVGLVSANSANASFNNTNDVTTQDNELAGYRCLSVVGPNFDPLSELLFTGKFASYGGTYNRTGPYNPIVGRFGADNDVDLLCDEVTVSEYDVIWLPGEYHDFNNSLSYYPTAVQLINDAYAEGLIFAALNHGIQMLAYCDIISGKNIGGPEPLRTEIEAAGGIFHGEDVGIITDSPFVTCSGWDEPLLIFAVAEALGITIETPDPTTWTNPSESVGIPISSLILIFGLPLLAFVFKKKRR